MIAGQVTAPRRRLLAFVGMRIVSGVAVLTAVVTLVFAVSQSLVDPALADLGPFATSAAIAERSRELGTDRPWLVQIAARIAAAWTFDFGYSLAHHRPVREVLWAGLGPTLAYAVPGFALATVAAATAALSRVRIPTRTWTRGLDTAAGVLIGSSSLVIVIMAHHVLAHTLGWFPLLGWPLQSTPVQDTLVHLLLPAGVWAALQWGPDYRMYRAVFSREQLHPHYEAMATRGLAPTTIRRHLLRGSAGTVIARTVQRVPHLLVGSIVIEEVFNIPGIGDAIVLGVRSSDLDLLQGAAIALAMATLIAQTLGDLLAAGLDPRMRTW